MRHLSLWLLSGAMLLSLASCSNDNYIEDFAYTDGTVGVEMTIQTRSLSNITSSSDKEYVAGTEWENYVDIAGGDYRIYFFEYDPDTETASSSGTNSTLIAEFEPTDMYSIAGSDYTSYTLSGKVDESLIESLENFKVVVVANWGKDNYPTESDIEEGLTIDGLCSYEKAVFDAFVSNGTATMPSADNLIPFFGLREYSGVTWRENYKTRLSGDITLLRSMAKVEVILEPNDDQEDVTFSNVSIVNYNAQGYCAPTGVYLRGDYDHDYTWAEDFVDGLHLVGNANDEDQTNHSISMLKTTNSEGKETWVAYVPEYDNMGDDYSYISLLTNFQLDTEPYKIYFANYTDGGTTAYGEGEDEDKGDRYNIYRDYLYRYHVTVKDSYLRVFVDTWDDAFDDEWTFGDMGEDGGDTEPNDENP